MKILQFFKRLFLVGDVHSFPKIVLTAPTKPKNIPSGSQWLAGEGAGSWFFLKRLDSDFELFRFTPQGELECYELFDSKGLESFHSFSDFVLDYPCNCRVITLNRDGASFQLFSKDLSKHDF